MSGMIMVSMVSGAMAVVCAVLAVLGLLHRARIKEWARWVRLAPRVPELEALMREAQDRAVEAGRLAAMQERRCASFEQLDMEKNTEIQRLIREVGSLERQLREKGSIPVTYGAGLARGQRNGLTATP